jgi:hypothetical protein
MLYRPIVHSTVADTVHLIVRTIAGKGKLLGLTSPINIWDGQCGGVIFTAAGVKKGKAIGHFYVEPITYL